MLTTLNTRTPATRIGWLAIALTAASILKIPVEIAFGGLGFGAESATLAFAVLTAVILLPLVLTAVLRCSLMQMAIAIGLHATIAVLYLGSLDQPSWMTDDPAADRSVVAGAVLHSAAATAGVAAMVVWAQRRRAFPKNSNDDHGSVPRSRS